MAAAAYACTLPRAARSISRPSADDCSASAIPPIGSPSRGVLLTAATRAELGAEPSEASSSSMADCQPEIISQGRGAWGSSFGQRARHCQQNLAPHRQLTSTTC
eukprot:scaffold78639_cov30-Tisochrysis_lutea.AAC.3